MKRKFHILGLALCLMAIGAIWSSDKALAQSGYPHHPLCGGAHAHSGSTSTICWSYATSRAFGRGWNDSRCPASTFSAVNSMSGEHFLQHGFVLSQIQAGDIIGWGEGHPNHVCYVTSISGQPVTSSEQVSIAQVDGPASISEFTGTLSNVINGAVGVTQRGYPTSLWRKRPRWSLIIKNSFTGGTVGVGSQEYPSPHTVSNLHWESSVTGVAVMDGREHENYIRRFRRWTSPYSIDYTVSAPLQVRSLNYTEVTDFTANLFKEFNVTFQISLLGAAGGVIKVKDTIRSAPHQTTVIEDIGGVTADAIPNEINRIQHTFARWNDGSTVNPRTFSVSNHVTWTAQYNAKPFPPANIAAGGAVGSNVCLTWQVHPHPNVTQYQIWRKVKHQLLGTFSPPVLLATVPQTATQFIDYDYVVTEGYTNDLVWYDVRSYFSLNTSYSDENWIAVFGNRDLVKMAVAAFAPTEWNLGNSPNPFNPTTRIIYALPQDGAVSLVIYDIQGREVALLVDGYREAGYYSTMWDGRTPIGSSVSSGVYFARLNVIEDNGKSVYGKTIKLLLAK